jgi:mono/diheme cytochrome c family protein
VARRKSITPVGLAVVLVGVGYTVLAFGQAGTPRAMPRPTLPALLLTQPIPDSVPNADQLRRGQYLVRVGDCASCHTPDGGQPFAGSYGLKTPFGVIYSTNLTSDAETGIGRMKPETFYAALHDGVGPKGGQIYPAMPYTHFTRVTRADTDAMLAYLKTTPPARSRRPANKLPFPLNIRFLMRGWNLLFFRPGTFKPDPAQSAEWNRGAYLVTGLGHCGSCHTPLNVLGGEKAGQRFRGGDLDNWVAPDLTANGRHGLGSWSRDDIVEYLKTGRNAHGNAGGPMAEVVSYSTSLLSDADLRAIALYLKDQPASPARDAAEPDPAAMRRGEAIYSDACASCHLLKGVGQARFFPRLAGNAVVQQADPAALTHLILAGSRTAPTTARPSPLSMPSFAWKLTDQQIADVATYIRNDWGNQAPPVTARRVADMRRTLDLNSVRLTDNSGDHPAPAVDTSTSRSGATQR